MLTEWKEVKIILNCDVRRCFTIDNLPHDKLIQRMRERIDDEPMMQLIDRYLKVHILDEKGAGCPTIDSILE